jgi:hypothetical protein
MNRICSNCGDEFYASPCDKQDVCPKCLIVKTRKENARMGNNLSDLNVQLFNCLEKLNSDTLTGEKLQTEIARSRAVTAVAQTIINNATLAVNAQVAISKYKIGSKSLKMIESGDAKQ